MSDTLEQQLAAAVQEQVAKGEEIKSLKAQQPQDKSRIDAAVAELKKIKQRVQALSKQCNPEEDTTLSKQRDALETLCLRRFFYRQAFSIYGGTAGYFTYGPPGSAAKNNLISLWRKHFVRSIASDETWTGDWR